MSPVRERAQPAVLVGIGLLAGALLGASLAKGDGEAVHADSTETLRRDATVRAVEALGPAVVNISTERVLVVRERLFGGQSGLEDFFGGLAPRRRVKQSSLGSGVIIDALGYVVTNAHVVARASSIEVAFPRAGATARGRGAAREEDVQSHAATLVNISPENDLALLQIDGPGPFPRAVLARPDDLFVGEAVIALGNPFGLESSVTKGVLSATGRSLDAAGGERFRDLLQTDAAINPGNSGGPLASIDGRVIGINTAIRADARGIGFAIPVSRVLSVVADLLDERELAGTYTGITFEGGTARIAAVEAGSPAALAGVRAGDEVTAAGGDPVSYAFDARRRILARKAGEALSLSLLRAKPGAAPGSAREAASVELTLAPAPAAPAERIARQRLGIQARSITPLLAERVGLQDSTGVLIVRAEKGSPAEAAGVQAGDVLARIGRPIEVGRDALGRSVVRWSLFEVPSLDALAQVLAEIPSGGRVLVQVIRDGRELKGEVATR